MNWTKILIVAIQTLGPIAGVALGWYLTRRARADVVTAGTFSFQLASYRGIARRAVDVLTASARFAGIVELGRTEAEQTEARRELAAHVSTLRTLRCPPHALSPGECDSGDVVRRSS
jgi:hypothetical protein